MDIDPSGFYPSDLIQLYKYGNLLLHGIYFPGYPLPAVGLFALLSLIPIHVAFVVILLLSIVALIHLFRRRAVLWAMYAPIGQCLVQGQVDVLCLWLMLHASPVSLALLTLKPQLFLFALPTLLSNRKLWKPFALWAALLWIPPTLLRPQWIGEFLHGASDGRMEGGTSASLWPVPLLALALIIYLIIARRFDWRVIVSSLNPLLRAYDYTMLAGQSLWLIPASWLCVALMWQFFAAWPMALVGLILLINWPQMTRLTWHSVSTSRAHLLHRLDSHRITNKHNARSAVTATARTTRSASTGSTPACILDTHTENRISCAGAGDPPG